MGLLSRWCVEVHDISIEGVYTCVSEINFQTKQLREAALDWFGGGLFPCPGKLSPGMSISHPILQ